jgi:hypothetical protein
VKPSARIAVLVASVAAIVVLFLLLQPGGGDEPEPSPSPSTPSTPTETATATDTGGPSPTRSATPSAAPTPDVVEIEIEVEDGRVDGRSEYAVPVGERVRIEVRADVADEVHVHGYDLMADVSPGRPAVIAFRADAAGVFEVELEDAGKLLFRLRVAP